MLRQQMENNYTQASLEHYSGVAENEMKPIEGKWSATVEALELTELRETNTKVIPIFLLFSGGNADLAMVDGTFSTKPYNHLSISLDTNPETLYTYTRDGGFVEESYEAIDGANYSLYKILVTEEIHAKLTDLINTLLGETPENLSEDARELIEKYFSGKMANTLEVEELICSKAITSLLDEAGVELIICESPDATPYDLIRSTMLKFVRRGVISVMSKEGSGKDIFKL